jgi:hypothetical protein
MTGGIREGVNMEKDGDSEEDNYEEVVKQVVKRRLSSSLPLSLIPRSLPHHLSILHSPESATSLPLFSFL